VSDFPHNFVYSNGDQQAADAVREALASRFSVVPGRRSRTVRRTWLDTFDWRLYRAGLTLEYVTGSGHGELVLTGATGERITAAANGTRWPALPDALPGGPLRDRLKAVTWVRALLPTAKAASDVAEFRLCNADDKTVAWLTVEHMLAAQPAAALLSPPPRSAGAAPAPGRRPPPSCPPGFRSPPYGATRHRPTGSPTISPSNPA
jgi:hypothetical protein